jgi:hypothetical protein
MSALLPVAAVPTALTSLDNCAIVAMMMRPLMARCLIEVQLLVSLKKFGIYR